MSLTTSRQNIRLHPASQHVCCVVVALIPCEALQQRTSSTLPTILSWTTSKLKPASRYLFHIPANSEFLRSRDRAQRKRSRSSQQLGSGTQFGSSKLLNINLHPSCRADVFGALSQSHCPARRRNREVRTHIELDGRPRSKIAPTRVDRSSTLRPTLNNRRTLERARKRPAHHNGEDLAHSSVNHTFGITTTRTDVATHITFPDAWTMPRDGTWKNAAGT